MMKKAMSSVPTDFWPDISISRINAPRLILEEQAAALGRRTKNVLKAVVSSNTTIKDAFHHSLRIVVPSLGSYQYELLWVEHGIDPYPLDAKARNSNYVVQVPNEEEFLEWLRTVLSSEDTAKVLRVLIAQVPEGQRALE